MRGIAVRVLLLKTALTSSLGFAPRVLLRGKPSGRSRALRDCKLQISDGNYGKFEI